MIAEAARADHDERYASWLISGPNTFAGWPKFPITNQCYSNLCSSHVNQAKSQGELYFYIKSCNSNNDQMNESRASMNE